LRSAWFLAAPTCSATRYRMRPHPAGKADVVRANWI
jgi:hypothetical protein